jgi:lysophospholipase L1-like esterase
MTKHHPLRRAAALSAVATAAFLTAVPSLAQGPASAPAEMPATAKSTCVVPDDLARFELPLSGLAHRLAGAQPVKVVAIGSSSTNGFGASSPSASYPSRLKVELEKHFPGHPLTVINRGVNGEEARDMLSRFETGVIAESPHLVIWQVGTNSLLRDRPVDPRGLILQDGLARLKAIHAEVVLMDPQFAPRVLAKPNRDAVVAQIAQTAKEEKVALLRRYAIMRRWHEAEGLPFETFLTWDGLHMNDWGYACLARSLGAAIAEAATRPTAAVAAPRTPR